MKIINNLFGKITKTVALAAVTCSLGLSHSHAADINFAVKLAGYTQRGNGWVLVLPELRNQLGGKVRWDDGLNSYVTDRVSRGETLRITLSATTRSEKAYKIAFTGIAPNNEFVLNQVVPLPCVNQFEVSRSPAFSDVHVTVWAIGGVPTTKRIPIGSR